MFAYSYLCVQGEDVGDIVKCRIEHDNSGAAPGWFLDKVSQPILAHHCIYVQWQAVLALLVVVVVVVGFTLFAHCCISPLRS